MECAHDTGLAGQRRYNRYKAVMKMLFFVSSMHAGGAERVAATLASAWARRGDTVTLARTYTGKGDCFYPLDPAVKLEWLADRMSSAGRKAWPPLSKLRAIR